MIGRFITALAFLTRLPLPGTTAGGPTADDVGRAALFFPAVGLLVGALQAALLWGLDGRLPTALAALLAVALGALITGALHLDGLADTADGFGGGRDREAVLRIMRDHAIGSYGAVALFLDLALRAAALAALAAAPAGGWRWVVLAPALARWAPVALGRALPYARPEGGLGAAVTQRKGTPEAWGATALALTAALLLGGARGAAALAGAAAVTALVGLGAWRRIGGVTGDVLGALEQLAEVALLLALAASR